MKKNRRKSISSRLVIHIVIANLIGVLLVSSMSFYMTQNIILDESLAGTRQQVARTVEEINGWFTAQETLLKSVATSAEYLDNPEKIRGLFIEQHNNNSQVYDIYLGLSSGLLISAIKEDGFTMDVASRPWYQKALADNGKSIVTGPYKDALSNKLLVTMSRYFGKIDGVDAVISVDLEMSSIEDIVMNMDVAGKGYALMTNSEGLILAHQNPIFGPDGDTFKSMNDNMAYAEVLKQQKAGAESIHVKDFDGESRFLVPYEVKESGWVLYAGVSRMEMIGPVLVSFVWVLIFYMMVVAATGTFDVLTLKRLLHFSLDRIIKSTNDLSTGLLTFTVRSNDNTSDEIGKLYVSFAKVFETIKSLIIDMDHMSKVHSEGEFEYKIEESRYTGAYLDIVSGINNMTFMYIDSFNELLQVLQKFGNGDFEVNVSKYPGKRASGNLIVDELRSNLITISGEIDNLARTAMIGDLSVRVNDAGFQGSWGQILLNLNNLIEAIAVPMKEASGVLQEVAQGRLESKMTGSYKGDFSKLKESLNDTVDQLFGYITEIRETLKAVMEHDMTVRISREFLGDFNAIKDSINSIIITQSDLLKKIALAAEQVNKGARQISESSNDLAHGASQQTTTIQQLTESIDSIDKQTRKNAENAKNADELSKTSMENTNIVNSEMKEMLSSMDGIKEASSKIGDVIKLIEDIAFQTNLLALNAAVEAARAGVHGKGFAIVAEEVRSLAIRSQTAAKDTQILIEDTVMKVNDGVRTANTTSESLHKIIENIESVSNLISDISSASKEQADAVSSVSKGINQISSVVYSNSTTAQESADAADNLSSQSETLNEMLDKYNN